MVVKKGKINLKRRDGGGLPPPKRARQGSVVKNNGPKKVLTFLDLPGELRNEVYRHTLVKGRIVITSRSEKQLETYGDVNTLPHNFRTHFRNMPTLARPVRKRAVWIADPMTTLRYDQRSRNGGGVKRYRASYEIDEVTSSINISLLLANKQIYHEAIGVFFEENLFSFEARWEDMCFAPLTFLSDQPRAFDSLRSLHLDMNAPPPFTCWDYTKDRAVLVTVPSNHFWMILVKELQRLPLRHFGLTVHGSVPEGLEINFDSIERDLPWVKGLYKLESIQSLRLVIQCWPWYDINFSRSAIPSTVAFVEGIQRKLLKDKSPDKDNAAQVYKALHRHGTHVMDSHLVVRCGNDAGSYGYESGCGSPHNAWVQIEDWKERVGEITDESFWYD
ncbi:uncharacterized protein BDR25DRAFT_312923 [Lindgomyces ingoldianus]|uniref:Uncharacterized protein n=1 Tax=Lindgomyces ingoldianus TaxID=673940 RepID=A0ACB6R1Q0_9PLEO|nr:uncharacterized protein BDR25DRAFT_312923 [Lindgomyces ingoldianus]KAF2472371.1 hypothetical protein BDR25DRAFT_312923 [Lindgomyces ingoldianus]